MARQKLLLISLITFSLFSLSSPLPSEAILSAADTLSDSGFLSMALTLRLVAQTLTPQPPSATIFCPSDAAFIDSGQPSLSVLKFHLSPLALSVESLRSLPFGTTIPTTLTGKSLIVTTLDSDDQISMNNVIINGSPIYDDGSLIVFGIDKFFDSDFQISSLNPNLRPDLQCVLSMFNPKPSNVSKSFNEATGLLRSKGYSVMASFLDLQLVKFIDDQKLTILAPVDEVMIRQIGNFTQYPSLFLRHVLPCKLTWTDLVNFGDGTVFSTSLEGFTIRITSYGDSWKLNEVLVIDPDLYNSDWIVVHGLSEILTRNGKSEKGAESPYEAGGNKSNCSGSDRSEF